MFSFFIVTSSSDYAMCNADEDQVPTNVKQLGTAKISFTDQQRHSSQVTLVYLLITHVITPVFG